MGNRDVEGQRQDPEQRATSPQPKAGPAVPVVAFGGASGSLQSLCTLLSHVPRRSGLAFVAMLDIPPKYWNPPHPWRRQRFPPGTGAISK